MRHKLIGHFKRATAIERKYKIIGRSSLLVLFIITAQLRKSRYEDIETIANLKNEIIALKKNVITYNRNFDEFPFPIWQKKKVGNDFIGQYFNPAYVKKFGHTFNNDVYNIIGKNNFELGFPKEMAQTFKNNDIAVSVFGRELRTVEVYKDTLGNPRKIKVIKWRVKRDKDTLVYGMVYEFLD